MTMGPEELIAAAKETMMKAYAPYSGFYVGAALLTKGGKVYTGCNIESASYSPTNCAERTAFFKAVSEGERDFEAIAVCGGEKGTIKGMFPPCGVCRQVMLEFCKPDFKIHLVHETGFKTVTLAELIPFGFNSAEHMGK